jgi:ATP-dependent RNA helicase DDX42
MSGWGGRGGRGFIRFQSAGGSSGGAAIPPPPSIQAPTVGRGGGIRNSKGFTPLSAIHQKASSVGGGVDPFSSGGVVKRRNRTEDEYFNDDEETDGEPLYQPAPGSPGAKGGAGGDSDEDDPLDAFMSAIEQEVKRQASAPKEERAGGSNKGIRDDIEDLDDEESYFKFMAENPDFGKDADSDNDLEYDEDGNPIAPKRSKWIDPLPPIDHATVEYKPFERNFYEEHPDIAALTEEQVEELRKTLGIKVCDSYDRCNDSLERLRWRWFI